MKIIDSHVHVTLNAQTSTINDGLLLERLLETYAQINVLNIVLEHGVNLPRNAIALLLKARNPGRAYSFGGVVMERGRSRPGFFSEQIKTIKAAGFDGVKLFGKPTVRRTRPYRFDDDMYTELYGEIVKQGMPLNFHIGDPPSFWEADEIPAFAKEKGWYYGDENLPKPGELIDELEGILRKFPALKIIVPHMMFLSHDLGRLSGLLDKYRNLYTDITPGVELYFTLLKDVGSAREFFRRYSNRVLFGTDSAVLAGEPSTLTACVQTGGTILRFLNEGGVFSGFGEHLEGLMLKENEQEAILSGNFRALCGETPRALNIEGVRAHCGFLMGRAALEGNEAAKREIALALDEIEVLADNLIGSSESV